MPKKVVDPAVIVSHWDNGGVAKTFTEDETIKAIARSLRIHEDQVREVLTEAATKRMANLQAFAVSRNGSVNLTNAPRYTITGYIEDVNPATGIRGPIAGGDFRGANAITFPGELLNRTPEERDFLIQTLAQILIQMKAGV